MRVTFVILFVACLLYPWHPPAWEGWGALWWNWAHVPLFGVITWMIMGWIQSWGRGPCFTVCSTLALLAGVAGGTEGLQSLTGRSADWQDFGAGLLGGGAGVCLFLWWQAGKSRTSRSRFRAILLGIATALTGCSALPLLQRGWVTSVQAGQFPILEDFESRTSSVFWHLERNGEPESLNVESRPPSGGRPRANQFLQLPVSASGLLSLHYDAQGRDWSPAKSLMFDYELPDADASLRAGIRLDVGRDASQRVRLESHLLPGKHTARILLPTDPRSKAALRRVGKLVLFTQDPGFDATLFLDNFRLELE